MSKWFAPHQTCLRSPLPWPKLLFEVSACGEAVALDCRRHKSLLPPNPPGDLSRPVETSRGCQVSLADVSRAQTTLALPPLLPLSYQPPRVGILSKWFAPHQTRLRLPLPWPKLLFEVSACGEAVALDCRRHKSLLPPNPPR
ncbi:hypothetical protein V6N13_038315 [Hibiscus sabdariffa]|uniref:Uncharacterized protein n=1 Tax=Hibiscus sabdariffa TaxID=183260 RepID=A0ABR2S296_9ROSI